jgi:hypothetical protein
LSLTVAIYGDFRAYRLAKSYERAFELTGAKVVRIDTSHHWRRLAPWLTSRAGHRISRRSLALRRWGAREVNAVVLDEMQRAQADLFFYLNGDYLMPETIDAIRALGTAVFGFHPDNPFPPFAHAPEGLRIARKSDAYFIWSERLTRRLREVGVPAHYLAFGWDPDVFPYQGTYAPSEHEVVFIGNWEPDREALLEVVARHHRLDIWGSSYWRERVSSRSRLQQCWRGGIVEGAAAAKIIGQAKIVLNPLRRQHHESGIPTGVIMRHFEVPGAGGFLVSTRTAEAQAFFGDGRGGAFYSTSEECLEVIEASLRDDSAREQKALEAHRTVDLEHRYTNRANELLGHLQRLRR